MPESKLGRDGMRVSALIDITRPSPLQRQTQDDMLNAGCGAVLSSPSAGLLAAHAVLKMQTYKGLRSHSEVGDSSCVLDPKHASHDALRPEPARHQGRSMQNKVGQRHPGGSSCARLAQGCRCRCLHKESSMFGLRTT
ncbi:unnamed protein product [Symbiodinium natans]|uniref:Uncharacterized protein n=1 Tax=Symbiodinium natans TaxID=878477 RepID=A0A812PS33_9DINO|nr:unnamed protein product [Symbiodinium natans]